MANPTSNFGWQMPTNTDLVKDLPADFEVFGQAVDTSLMDLKGGTTGQVLSKASNTDMDFTWVTSDDANAIQNTIVDAKGDLISASANDVPARLAVGNNGESLVAHSSTSTGLRWQGNFAAGKNAIINGDFRLNQRAFTSATTNATYGFDRWALTQVDNTTTYSAQSFTLGTAPVAGYEGTNYARLVTAGQTLTSAQSILRQRIESVRTFAGQTVTVSFWAQSGSGTPNVAVEFIQSFGLGGSPSASVTGILASTPKQAISTTWTRYSFTIDIPSISGKTLGTNGDDYLQLGIWVSAGSDLNARTGSLGIQSNTFNFWGVQVEAGSVATAFQTATGTLAGELALAQRYYQRQSAQSAYTIFGSLGAATSTIAVFIPFANSTTFRVTPTAVDYSTLIVSPDAVITSITPSAIVITTSSSPSTVILNAQVTGATQFRPYYLYANNSSSAYIGLSAEL